MDFLSLPYLAFYGKSLLFALIGILPIINPLASAPLFVDYTRGLNDDARARLARRIGQSVMVLLSCAMVMGSYVLDFFGVSLPAVRIAGGMVVASIAWRMLNAQQVTSDDATQMVHALTEDKAIIKAFYPLTFPLTCGPGSIAVAIAIGASLHTRRSVTETLFNMAGGLTAAVLLGLLVSFTFRYSSRLLHRLGETRKIVFLRLMAFLLLCVGVEIIWNGVQALVMPLLAGTAAS